MYSYVHALPEEFLFKLKSLNLKTNPSGRTSHSFTWLTSTPLTSFAPLYRMTKVECLLHFRTARDLSTPLHCDSICSNITIYGSKQTEVVQFVGNLHQKYRVKIK